MNFAPWHPVPWIFFDLDDTIWNFTENSTDSLIKLYHISPILKKLFPSIEEFIDIFHHHNAILWDLYAKGDVSTKELKIERWRRTLSTRQFEVLTAVCEELETNYLDILAQGDKMIPGVEDMLRNLSAHYMLAVLSNGFQKTQYKKLKYSGLERFITRTIVSDEIGINKPDRRLFEYAVMETGAVDPVIMVGDNPETDILGALKAGWYAIWYNPKGKECPFSEKQLEEMGIPKERFIATIKSIPELEKTLQNFL